MPLPEDLCNRSPGFCALIIQEKTPSPLPIGCLTYGLPKVNRKHCVVVAQGYRLLLLLPATGGPALPGFPFRLCVPHQACVETPLLEVHLPGDPRPDFPGPTDAQRLRKKDMGKDEGSLGVPTPVENPLLFNSQYGRKAVTHYS